MQVFLFLWKEAYFKNKVSVSLLLAWIICYNTKMKQEFDQDGFHIEIQTGSQDDYIETRPKTTTPVDTTQTSKVSDTVRKIFSVQIVITIIIWTIVLLKACTH